MAGWLHGVFVGDWLFVFSLCGFSLSLFCNYFRESVACSNAQSSAGAAGAGPVHCTHCTHFRRAKLNLRLKNTTSGLIRVIYEML